MRQPDRTTKAVAALRNVYFRMPLSGEADTANDVSCEKLPRGNIPQSSLADRRTRADLLAKGKRYTDAADRISRSARRGELPTSVRQFNSRWLQPCRRADAAKMRNRFLNSMPDSHARDRCRRSLFNARRDRARLER